MPPDLGGLAVGCESGDEVDQAARNGPGSGRRFVGWFPAERPRWVVVVFCENTLQTASNSAIWLARQLLRLFAFLPTRAELDLLGWEGANDIFLH